MSAFRPSSGGSGITPEQLAALVDDGELSAAQVAILAAIPTPASPEAVAAVQAALTSKSSQASVDAVKADTDSIKATLAAGGGSGGSGSTAAAMQGEVRMLKVADAPAGWAKLTGVYGPENLFQRGRIFLAHYDRGQAGDTSPATLTDCASAVTGAGEVLLVRASTKYAYNPDTETLRPLAAFSSTYTWNCGLTVDDKVYFMASQNNGTTCARYDVAQDAWTTLTSVPESRVHSAKGYDPTTGKIYVFGGYSSSGSVKQEGVRVFDVASGTWEPTPRTLDKRLQYGVCVPLGGGKLLIMGSLVMETDGTTYSWPAANFRIPLVYDCINNTLTPCDEAPAGVSLSSSVPGVVLPWTDGKALWLPQSRPTGTTARGYFLDPAAPAGSQWQPAMGIAGTTASLNANTNNDRACLASCRLPNGLIMTTVRTEGSVGSDALCFISLNEDGTLPKAPANYFVKT